MYWHSRTGNINTSIILLSFEICVKTFKLGTLQFLRHICVDIERCGIIFGFLRIDRIRAHMTIFGWRSKTLTRPTEGSWAMCACDCRTRTYSGSTERDGISVWWWPLIQCSSSGGPCSHIQGSSNPVQYLQRICVKKLKKRCSIKELQKIRRMSSYLWWFSWFINKQSEDVVKSSNYFIDLSKLMFPIYCLLFNLIISSI